MSHNNASLPVNTAIFLRSLQMHRLVSLILACAMTACSVEPISQQSSSAYQQNIDARQLLELHNQIRSQPRRCKNAKQGRAKSLTWNSQLAQAAKKHSSDMAKHQSLSHTGSNGSNTKRRLAELNYHWLSYGENIAYGGQLREADVMKLWLSKKSHCENIMDRDFASMGAAYHRGYWTVVFGREK